MSLTLSFASTATPAASASASASAQAAARADDDQGAGSFGQAMARSLAPEADEPAEPAAKPASAPPARRQSAAPRQAPEDAQNLPGPLALPLLPLENRPIPATAGGSATATAGDAARGALHGLRGLRAQTPAAPGREGPAGALADQAAQKPQGKDAQGLQGMEGMQETGEAQDMLASFLAAARQKRAGHAPAGSSAAAAPSEGAAPQADAPRAAAAADAASALARQAFGQAEQEEAALAADADLQKAAPALAFAASEALAHGGAPPAGPAHAASAAGAGGPGAPAPAATAPFLAPEVGSGEWGQALGQHMVRMDANGQPVAELQLNPPGLGPLTVTLSMHEQQMQATFVSAHAAVRAAVEAALPELRAQLADGGISLGQTSVGAQSQPRTPSGNGQNDQPERPGQRPAGLASRFSQAPEEPASVLRRANHGLHINTYA